MSRSRMEELRRPSRLKDTIRRALSALYRKQNKEHASGAGLKCGGATASKKGEFTQDGLV